MDISTKLFFEDNLWIPQSKEEIYVVNAIRNCNAEGEFAKKIGQLRIATPEIITQNLSRFKEENYDMLIGYKKGDIIGNITFQKHINSGSISWKIFDYTIKKDYQGRGYCHDLTEKLIEIARNKKTFMIKIGQPKINEREIFSKKLIEKIMEKEKILGISADIKTHQISFIK
ncbi:MAG: GNAT family N-acetyltransferase [Nanoarchaeota archaeon]|mgnify:CR=1 FL=1